MRNRFLMTLVIAVVAWLAGEPPLSRWLGVERMELLAWDHQVAAGGRRHPSPSIVLVAIDAASLEAIPEPLSLWSRHHAELIRGLRQAGATVVGFDLLPTASYDELVLDRAGDEVDLAPQQLPADDAALAQEARRGPVLFIEFADGDGRLQRPFPLLTMALGAAGLAAANLSPDDDSVVRRQVLALATREGSRPTLALLMALRHRGVPVEKVSLHEASGLVHLDGLPVRILEGEPTPTVLLDFRGPPGTFPTVPYHQALAWARSGAPQMERFRGRAVLVCSTDPGQRDYFPVAASTRQLPLMSGGEVHANAFETLLAGAPLRPLPRTHARTARAFLVLAVALLALWAPPVVSLAGALALGGMYCGAAWAAFQRFDLWVPVAAPLTCGLLALGGVDLYRYLSEFRERRRLGRVLARYVSAPVAREILADPAHLGLGGTRRHLSILMSDIDDFTTISEARTPEEIMTTLNEYFTLMEGIIDSERGTLKQFVGDEIMVLFGAPVPRQDHAAAAARTAWKMHCALQDWARRRREAGQIAFTAKIGLHTGEVVVGNVGSPNRTEYAAVGDVVNTTARIEGLNKKLGTAILMSREFLEAAGSTVGSRPAGTLPVKGRRAEVEVFELLSLEEPCP